MNRRNKWRKEIHLEKIVDEHGGNFDELLIVGALSRSYAYLFLC